MSLHSEGMPRRDRLEDEQERVQVLNNDLVQPLNVEIDKRLQINQEFETFQAHLEAEKQKELVLLALKRIVSSTSKYLPLQTKAEAQQSMSNYSSLTCSMISIKDDVSGQDSGLDVNEEQRLKDENQEHRLENAKLQSELHSIATALENQRATIEEREEDLKVARQKWKMFEDHSSLLALHAHELSERKEMMEEELEFMAKQLEDIEVNHAEVMKKMEDKHTRDKNRFAIKMKKAEEVAASLKKNNTKLKEELMERDLHNQAKDIVGEAIMKGVHANLNEDMGRCLMENKCLVDEMALLKTQIVHQESKILESANMLQESQEKCKVSEEKECLLRSRLDEISIEKSILTNELALKEKEIEFMEATNIEEMKKIADQNQDKVLKELLKSDLLEEEIAKYRSSQAEMEEKLREKELLLKSKQTEFDSIIGSYEAETTRYQEEIKVLQRTIKEGEVKCNSLKEKEVQLETQLVDAKRELINLKDLYQTKMDELMLDNSNAYKKFLNEQAEKLRTSNALKAKLRWIMKKPCQLDEVNKELNVIVERLQLELTSREERIKELDEQLMTLNERLNAKDIAIEQLSMKKSKRRGIRRFLCC